MQSMDGWMIITVTQHATKREKITRVVSKAWEDVKLNILYCAFIKKLN